MSEPLKPLDWYRDLTEAKSRRESGCFLIEGERAVRQAAGQRPDLISELLTTGEVPVDLAGYPVRELTEKQLRSISSLTTPQGLLAVARLPQDYVDDTLPDEPGDRILLLERLQDPGNAGTLIRTAAAFGYDGVILSADSADPFSPKVVQAAAGAIFSLWLRRTEGYTAMASTLRQQGYRLVATMLDGEDDISALTTEKLVLALGNEANGLSDTILQLADHHFRVPVARDQAESLNVAVCGGICMYLSKLPRA